MFDDALKLEINMVDSDMLPASNSQYLKKSGGGKEYNVTLSIYNHMDPCLQGLLMILSLEEDDK